MEKEDLMRVIQFLQQHNLPIKILVTDRHRQIGTGKLILKSSTTMMCGMLLKVDV